MKNFKDFSIEKAPLAYQVLIQLGLKIKESMGFLYSRLSEEYPDDKVDKLCKVFQLRKCQHFPL